MNKNKEAIQLFIADEKHQRTIKTIELLLTGLSSHAVAKQVGISSRSVCNIREKYIGSDEFLLRKLELEADANA